MALRSAARKQQPYDDPSGSCGDRDPGWIGAAHSFRISWIAISALDAEQRRELSAREAPRRRTFDRDAPLLQHDEPRRPLAHVAVIAIDDEGRDARGADLADDAPHL